MSSKLRTVVFLNSSNRETMSLGNLARAPDFMDSIFRFSPFTQLMMCGVPFTSTPSTWYSGWVVRKTWSRLPSLIQFWAYYVGTQVAH